MHRWNKGSMAANWGPNALLCMPNKTNYVRLVSVTIPPREPVKPFQLNGSAGDSDATERCQLIVCTSPALLLLELAQSLVPMRVSSNGDRPLMHAGWTGEDCRTRQRRPCTNRCA
jgi:hypothetical protein